MKKHLTCWWLRFCFLHIVFIHDSITESEAPAQGFFAIWLTSSSDRAPSDSSRKPNTLACLLWAHSHEVFAQHSLNVWCQYHILVPIWLKAEANFHRAKLCFLHFSILIPPSIRGVFLFCFALAGYSTGLACVAFTIALMHADLCTLMILHFSISQSPIPHYSCSLLLLLWGGGGRVSSVAPFCSLLLQDTTGTAFAPKCKCEN